MPLKNKKPMTSQEYLERELLAQSPKERLRTKLGMNSYNDTKFDDVYKRAQLKTRSASKCDWCGGIFSLANVRVETKLCNKCSGGRQAIEYYKRNHKVHVLTEADKLKIANSGITRYGRQTPK